MSLIIPKSQMTEEDIKLQFITPALQAKWPLNLITMETKITDGRINLQGNKVSREKAKKADYILYINAGNPIAVVEAKDNNHSVSFGLQQAVTYAKMLDVKFAYSSNGDGFEELDLITGEERTIGMDEFPTPDELFERYDYGLPWRFPLVCRSRLGRTYRAERKLPSCSDSQWWRTGRCDC